MPVTRFALLILSVIAAAAATIAVAVYFLGVETLGSFYLLQIVLPGMLVFGLILRQKK